MTDAVLRIEDLNIGYIGPRGVVPAVDGISFELHARETVAIVGESGSGKSTTAHAVMRLLAENARVRSGRVLLGDDDLLTVPERRLRDLRGRRIGYVPQEPGVSLNPTKRIGEHVAETLRRHFRMDRSEISRRVLELLEEVGLDDPERVASAFPHQLSGGMRQRVLIAVAMSCDPSVIIADEPTSALDVTVQKLILDRLGALVQDRGSSLLLVTHDLGIAADRADRVIVMQHGQVVEQGDPEEVLATPTHPYTRALVAAAPGINFTAGAASSRQRPASDERPVLRATSLSRTFVSDRGGEHVTAADDISLRLLPGRTVALVGESGSGKTTTARMCSGLEAPDSGAVTVNGTDLAALHGRARRQARRRVQYVHQNPYASLDPRFTVERLLCEALTAGGVTGRGKRRERAIELVAQVALPSTVLRRLPRELSGGQRQRVAIARALAVRPDVLILDEPVSALDVSVQAEILALLEKIQEETSAAYLFITHDLAVVRLIADEVHVMRHGRVVESGTTDQVLGHPQHPYTRTLLESVPGRRRPDSTRFSAPLLPPQGVSA